MNRATILLAILVLGLSGNPILGEETPVTFELEQIVVTATRMEEKASDVPANLSVISKEEIESSYAKNVPDLLKHLAGVYVYDSSGVGSAGRINMRGFWGGMSTHNLVLINGIPINSGKDRLVDWNLIPINNIERIEVVRGGHSALYGDNAFSGVINIITKKLPDTLEITAFVSGGSFGTMNYRFGVGGAFFDKVNYLLNISSKKTVGYRKHCEYKDLHLDAKLRVKDSGLTLSAGYHKTKRGAYPWPLTEDEIADDRRQARPGTEEDEGEDERINLELNYKHPRVSVTGYMRREQGNSFGTFFSTKEYIDDENTWGLNIQSEFSYKVNSFVVGTELEQNKVDTKVYKAPDNIRGDLERDQSITRKKVGVYLEDKIEIGPVTIIPAIRYDYTDYDVVDNKEKETSRLKLSALSPKIGVVYAHNSDIITYINAGKSFRGPTLSQLFTYEAANPELKPEEGQNVEMGIRYRAGNILSSNLSIYQMDVDGEIYYDSAEKKYKNRSKTSHKGIEADVKAKIMEPIVAELNCAWIKAKDKNTGYYLTNVPQYKANLRIGYQNKSIAASLTATYTGSSYIDKKNTKKLSEYTILDGNISYQFMDRFVISLSVNNILDKEYYCYGYETSSGTNKYNPAPGRTFKLGLEYSF